MARSPYAEMIRATLATLGLAGYDPGEVEAWMRCEWSTLDGIPRWRWGHEVETAAACVRASTPEENRAVAASFGLAPRPDDVPADVEA